MFVDNKYTTWYYQIISRAATRTLVGYAEVHHIIPKSLGGTNNSDNLIQLTAREHLICHMLLPKMVSGNAYHKMINALWAMSKLKNNFHQRRPLTSRAYENLKKLRSIVLSEMYSGQNNLFYGKTHNEHTKEKIRQARLGKKDSAQTRELKSIAGKKKPPATVETRQKISNANKGKQGLLGDKNGFYGKTHSPEQREKKRQEKLAAKKKVCYYCNKEIDPMNYARWHGDNCKYKQQ